MRRGEEQTTLGRYLSITPVLSSRESLVHLILSCQIGKGLEMQDCMDESKPRLRLCRFSVGMESILKDFWLSPGLSILKGRVHQFRVYMSPLIPFPYPSPSQSPPPLSPRIVCKILKHVKVLTVLMNNKNYVFASFNIYGNKIFAMKLLNI